MSDRVRVSSKTSRVEFPEDRCPFTRSSIDAQEFLCSLQDHLVCFFGTSSNQVPKKCPLRQGVVTVARVPAKKKMNEDR
jgi:hypothetical protein